MTRLILDLPQAAGIGAFDWLLARMQSGEAAFVNDIVTLRESGGDNFALSLDDGGPRIAIALAPPALADAIEIAPNVRIQAMEAGRLVGFLADQWGNFDHLGINLSYRDVGEDDFHGLVAAIGAALPAYRLDVGSENDIVMIVAERAGGNASVVELVYDRGARRSSFHVCARVAADRAQVDAAFPAPFGAYKPGDEPFFRSVALPFSPRLPSYVDLAFADAQMAPWPQIVAAMGKRIA